MRHAVSERKPSQFICQPAPQRSEEASERVASENNTQGVQKSSHDIPRETAVSRRLNREFANVPESSQDSNSSRVVAFNADSDVELLSNKKR